MTIEELYSNIYPVQNPDLKREIIACTEICRLKKHDFLTRQEEQDDYICFLKSGVTGAFEMLPDGRTVCLTVADRIGDVVAGGLKFNDVYGHINIVAMTRAELFTVRVADMQRFQTEYPESQILYNRILMQAYEEQWQVKNMLYMEDAKARYDWFNRCHPGTVDKVNHKNIASFLRMSPVTFSRIRHDWKAAGK